VHVHQPPSGSPPAVRERVLPGPGGKRRFLLYVPPGLAPGRPAPLVMEFHGSGALAQDQMRYSGLHRLAREHGFVLAAPEGAIPLRMLETTPEGRAWHVPGVPLATSLVPGEPAPVGAGPPPDDVAFVREVVAAVAAEVPVDRDRVYAAGFSGGGRFCSHLAYAASGLVAAVATVAGLRLPAGRGAGAPVPVIAFHGTSDPINPYRGGAGSRWDLSVPDTADAVAGTMGCRRPGVEESVTASVSRLTYATAAGEPRLVHYTVHRGGHNWPGTPAPEYTQGLGRVCYDIDASALIWEFFAGRRLCGRVTAPGA
jgi:polyhydroxybutyrate depolymerase